MGIINPRCVLPSACRWRSPETTVKNQPTTKSQKARAEVCGKYAAVLNDYTLEEAIANYRLFDNGHKVDGDMLAIGNAYNANKANQPKPR